MSLTPLDEGQETTTEVALRESGPPSRRERLVAGLRSLVEALPFGRRLFDRQSSPHVEQASESRSHSTHPLSRRSEDLPQRERPISTPLDQTGGQNAVELVGEERGDTLTIMYPDYPETAITSDVFVDVER